MFFILNRKSRTVRLLTALVVTAWLVVCGQSCAEAGSVATAAKSKPVFAGSLAKASDASVNSVALHHIVRDHAPRSGNQPACDGSACCAKMTKSDHGKLPIPANVVPLPAPDTLLFTLPIAAISSVEPFPDSQPIPNLSPLQRSCILRI